MHEGRKSAQILASETAFSGLFERLERSGSTDAQSAEEIPAATRLEPAVEEPLSPELVLVDPDLARRARKQLPEREPERQRVPVELTPPAQEPLFGFVQPAPTSRVLDGQPRAPKRRRAGQILVLLILATGAALAILRVDPLKHPFWKSRKSSVAPAGRAQSPPSLPPATIATPKPAPKRHAASGRRTAPSRTSAKPKRRSANPRPPQVPRVFAWIAVPKASYYLVQFYHGGAEIFEAQPSAPRLLLPHRWSFKGHRYSLVPGRYQWSVRPGYGPRSQARYGEPVVRAKLVVQRGSGG